MKLTKKSIGAEQSLFYCYPNGEFSFTLAYFIYQLRKIEAYWLSDILVKLNKNTHVMTKGQYVVTVRQPKKDVWVVREYGGAVDYMPLSKYGMVKKFTDDLVSTQFDLGK
jgi:hypothetical protein